MQNKTVLITGGTGSFGRELARYLLSHNLCAKLIIFSRDEWKQWEMRSCDPLFDHPNIRYFLGDVRDLSRLQRAFQGVDIVVHAAALKQVPAAEYNPTEFIKTNVMGAMNIVDAAIDQGVGKVLALSTDKACNPVNLYGATKLCSDKLFLSANVYTGAKDRPRFSTVRYGNVLGSRGSLIPFWRALIAKGANSIPLTDERMTRFWMTLSQAVEFTFHSLQKMRGGETFIPKIPSMRIVELASVVAPNVSYHISGVRPGEKIHETLIPLEEGRHTFEFSSHYVISPFHDTYPAEKLVTDGFSYTSDTNTEWLSSAQLRKMIISL